MDALLAEPAPASYLLVTTATWRGARAVAHAAKKQFAHAQREYEEFQRAKSNIPEDYLWASDTVHRVLEVSDYFILGEIALQNGHWDKAAHLLEKAITIEDTLAFREPPQWLQPEPASGGGLFGRHRRLCRGVCGGDLPGSGCENQSRVRGGAGRCGSSSRHHRAGTKHWSPFPLD
jgi:hypothetical protein